MTEKPQPIILKEGCWIQTIHGIYKINEETKADATPIFFSSGELVGYRFTSFSYTGVTYDLERMLVGENREN